jgi:hypothetical protein
MRRTGRSLRSGAVATLLSITVVAGSCAGPPPTQLPESPAVATTPTNVATPSPPPTAEVTATADGDQLPAPASVAGSPETQAEQLAGLVLQGGDGSLAALLAATAASGLTVRDLDFHTVREPAQPSQGLALLAGQVITLDGLEQQGEPIPLDDFAGAVATLGFGLDKAEGAGLGRALVDRVKAAATSDVPTVRFWGLFLTELGRQGVAHYDLLGETTKTPPTVDAVQATFLLLRIMGDLAALYPPTSPSTSAAPTASAAPVATPDASGSSGVQDAPPWNLVRGSVCDVLSEFWSAVSDASDLTLGKAGPAGPDDLDVWLKKYAKSIAPMGPIWSIIQYLMLRMLLDMDLQLVEGGPVIERTKDRVPGNRGTLQAKVVMNTANLSYVACLKHVAAFFGIGIDYPDNGAVKDAKVVWHLDGFVLQFQHCETGCATMTDANGFARMVVEGAPQQRPLPKNPPPVMKSVRVSYTLQKQSKAWQDVLSGVGFAIDPAGGAIDVALDAIQRIGDRGASLNVPVRDWVQDWPPFIRLKVEGSSESSGRPGLGDLTSQTWLLDTVLALSTVAEEDGTALYLPRADARGESVGLTGEKLYFCVGGGSWDPVSATIPLTNGKLWLRINENGDAIVVKGRMLAGNVTVGHHTCKTPDLCGGTHCETTDAPPLPIESRPMLFDTYVINSNLKTMSDSQDVPYLAPFPTLHGVVVQPKLDPNGSTTTYKYNITPASGP